MTMRPRPLSLLALCLSLSVSGCLGEDQGADMGAGPLSPEALNPGAYDLPTGQVTHPEALATLDAAILDLHVQIEAKPLSWLTVERLAGAQAQRARLTGSINDFLDADASLAASFAKAPDGAGPWLTRAHLDFSLHRFELAGEALDEVETQLWIDDPTRSAIHGLRGELALQHGELDDADLLADEAESLDPSATTASRQAQLRWRRGDYAGASALYLDGLTRYHGLNPAVPAWFHLQLGIMQLERLEYDAALEHFMAANAELSGYYLVEEHIAEIWALQGRYEQSLGLYLDIVERTQNPEFMDAIAGLHLQAGDPADAEPWIDAASEAFTAQLAATPALAYGHALGHFIEFGPSEKAVELAVLNLELRPNGDARAELVRAYLADAQLAAAVAEAEALASSSWRTANTLSAVLEALAAAGQLDGELAVEVHAELCAMAPKAC